MLANVIDGAIIKAGGKVLGSAAFPFPDRPPDFSAQLQQAPQPGATVLGLCNFGADLCNTIKQARSMGLNRTMRFAAFIMFASNKPNLGLESAQGLLLTETFYWDLNAHTRAFTDRIRPNEPTDIPASVQAGNYAATAAARADGAAVVARMKAMPTNDDCFGQGHTREDGRKLHLAYLLQVKAPAESRGAWDALKLIATTPADQAFRPLSEDGCPFAKA
jgi:branched-chain amino acid transport system substrate-binding protein